MASKKRKNSIENPDPGTSAAILSRAVGGELPCAVAFELAKNLPLPPEQIGMYADTLGIRLVKCQLGLFGYGPGKKIVKSLPEIPEELQAAIEEATRSTDDPGRIACRKVWEIAERMNLPKLRVAGACEKKGLRIKPCQLGAF